MTTRKDTGMIKARFKTIGCIWFNPFNALYISRTGVLFAPGVHDFWCDAGEYERVQLHLEKLFGETK